MKNSQVAYWLSIDSRVLFVAGRVEGAVRVQAIEIPTFRTIWSSDLKASGGNFSLALPVQDQLLVAHDGKWTVVDTMNGGPIREQSNFGPVSAASLLLPLSNEKLLSLGGFPRTLLVNWNQDLSPEWIHVGIFPLGSITISTDGTLIAKSSPKEPGQVSQGKLLLESQSTVITVKAPDPEQAFCVVQHRSDGSQFVTPGIGR